MERLILFLRQIKNKIKQINYYSVIARKQQTKEKESKKETK